MRKVTMLLCVLALLWSGVALATNSSLKGEVKDDQGSPLPGATVTIESPTQLGGARTEQTEGDGTFSFANVDPGIFTVKVELDGFVTQEQSGVQVRAGRTQTVTIQMSSGEFEETVQVTAEAPVIDPEQVSISNNFSEEYLQKAAVGSGERSYQSVLDQAPGVAGGSNPNVLGSTLGENAFYFDGVNTTDPVTATFSGNYSYDIIQEISFETGGFEAQYGNATGGVVNVVTKSGGNNFSGTVDVRYYDDGYFEEGEFFDPELQDTKFLDPSFTFGGPLQRDRLWFFLAYNPTETKRTAPGAPTTRTFTGDQWFSKLSYQLNPNWRLVFKANGDPTEIENAAFTDAQFRPPETQRIQEQGGELYQLDLSGVLSSNLLWDARIGVIRRELNSVPSSGNLELPGHENPFNGNHYVNYTNAQFSNRDRDVLATDLSWFKDDWGGDHEFRFGAELNDDFFRSQNYTTGNYSFTRRDVNGREILRNFTNNPNRDTSEFEGTINSVYAQDGWSVRPNVTLKLGVRYDQAKFDNNLNENAADLSKLQPRVGLAWDLTGDGKTIARASWGRFMHPSALTSASFAQRGVNELPRIIAWSCNYVREQTFGRSPSDTTPCSAFVPTLVAAGWEGSIIQEPQGLDPEGWVVSDILGGAGQPNVVAAGLDATYQDTVIFGVERQLAPRTSIEVSYVDKETFDIFEDTCDGALSNPQEGHECNFYVMDNLPGLTRDYQGVLTRFETRNRWMHLISSLTWSESKGNVQYTQNAGADFDHFPDHYVNRYGYLDDHRRWRFKVNGYFNLPAGFNLGVEAFWSSASRWNVTTPAENAGYSVRYVEPRGFNEGNENYQLDVQLGKNLRIGRFDLQLIGAVINVFDTERPDDRCESLSGCGGSVGLNDPLDWQEPRRYELGVRFEF